MLFAYGLNCFPTSANYMRTVDSKLARVHIPLEENVGKESPAFPEV